MTNYEKLKKLHKDFPNLTFQNEGYEYIKEDTLTEKDKKAIKEIESILKEDIDYFVKFNNFKIGRKGGVIIRVQCDYSPSFTGVRYFPLEYFK